MSDTNTLYFLLKGDEQSGPFTIGQLRSMWQSGSITAQTQYWFDGAPEWRPLINLLALLEPKTEPVVAITAIQKPLPPQVGRSTKPLPPQVGRAYRIPSAQFAVHRESDPVVTTQLTSKPLKLQQGFAFLLGLVGVVLSYICWIKLDEIKHREIMQILTSAQTTHANVQGIEFALWASLAIVGIGVLWLLITSIRIWWHHG
jgi:hypothetical protein